MARQLKYKPLIVGLLTPYPRMFKLWILENKKSGERYVHLASKDDSRGRVFDRLERLQDWDPDVYRYTKLRVR